jgi:hypothetical protein
MGGICSTKYSIHFIGVFESLPTSKENLLCNLLLSLLLDINSLSLLFSLSLSLSLSLKACIDFGLACQREDIRDNFEDNFPLWARAIIAYCKKTQVRSMALQNETANYNEDIAEGMLCHSN